MTFEERIQVAEAEARRFLDRCEKWQKSQGVEKTAYGTFKKNTFKENGALKRSSMDLTRALAEIRKPQE